MQKSLPSSSEKIKIETPIGSIESDSGHHLIDMATVLILFVVIVKIYQKIKAK